MSVRLRVTATAVVTVLIVLSIASVALVVAHRATLTATLEEGVAVAASDLVRDAADGSMSMPLRTFGDDDAFAQVVDLARGTVVASSSNLRGAAPVTRPPARAGDRQWRTLRSLPIDDERFRVLSIRTGDVVVHAGATLDDVDESVSLLARSLAVAVPAVTALLGAVVWLLIGRTLQPVEAIRAEVAAIGGSELHRRVPVPRTDDEVGRLARTMNDMLSRVEQVVRQQEHFVADASHELRGPLTRMRSELEVDLAHPGSADLEATHRSVLEETVGLQQLVDDLLLLARNDEDAGRGHVIVDLDDIVRAFAVGARGGGLQVDERLEPVQVRGDGRDLARAVGNLVANATRYATNRIGITVVADRGDGVVVVEDDGPGVPEEARERIFDRFTRLDEARSANTGGAGLGLAIARAIAARHGGTITVDSAEGGGARFVMRIPQAAR